MEHLLNMIQKYYKCSCDWDGKRYCGLTIKWDYASRKVHLSITTYVKKTLQHFQHPPPMIPHNQPHPSVKKTYGAKGISTVCKPSRRSSSTRKSRKEVHPRGHASIPIFGQSSQWQSGDTHDIFTNHLARVPGTSSAHCCTIASWRCTPSRT